MLIGKAKEDFEKWVKIKGNDFGSIVEAYPQELIVKFEHLEENLQNALIIDWFDSVDIYISIQPKRIISDWIFDVLISEEVDSVWSDRKEATTEGIKKANEIYNNVKK